MNNQQKLLTFFREGNQGTYDALTLPLFTSVVKNILKTVYGSAALDPRAADFPILDAQDEIFLGGQFILPKNKLHGGLARNPITITILGFYPQVMVAKLRDDNRFTCMVPSHRFLDALYIDLVEGLDVARKELTKEVYFQWKMLMNFFYGASKSTKSKYRLLGAGRVAGDAQRVWLNLAQVVSNMPVTGSGLMPQWNGRSKITFPPFWADHVANINADSITITNGESILPRIEEYLKSKGFSLDIERYKWILFHGRDSWVTWDGSRHQFQKIPELG